MLELLNDKKNEINNIDYQNYVDKLKETLTAFNIEANVTLSCFSNAIIYNITCKDILEYEKIFDLKKEIGLSLGINVKDLEINTVDNHVEIIVVKEEKSILSLKELLVNFKLDNSLKVALGLSIKDEIITFDFDKDKNLLVTGVTGTGKTNLFNNIIMNLLINYDNINIIILDSQKINYNCYSDILEVVNDENSIISKIKSIRKDFEEKIKNNVVDDTKTIIFIDEVYEIIKMDESVKNDINYLLEVGNVSNIHLIVSTDSVIEDEINNLFNKENLSKLSFYLTTRGEYNMFLNTPVTSSLKQDAMYLDTDKRIFRISIPLIEDDEIKGIVDYKKKNCLTKK